MRLDRKSELLECMEKQKECAKKANERVKSALNDERKAMIQISRLEDAICKLKLLEE